MVNLLPLKAVFFFRLNRFYSAKGKMNRYLLLSLDEHCSKMVGKS